MRKRNLLVIAIVMALTLSFASQALTQAPIVGWDKAKFGMSPEEVEAAYGEEMSERYSEDGDRFITSLPLRHSKGFMGSVTFCFVDNKLFEISLFFVKSGKLVREVRRFWLALVQVESLLKEKYGAPVGEERIGERKVLRWVDTKGNGLSLMMNFERDDIEFHWFEVAYFHQELTERWETKFTEKKGYKKLEIDSF